MRLPFVLLAVSAGILGVVLPLGAPRAEEFHRLGNAEIRAAVIGKELTDNVHVVEYYRRDGVLLMASPGSADWQQGRWSVERDQLCVAQQIGAARQCFQVWISGAAVSLRRREQDRPPLSFVRAHQSR